MRKKGRTISVNLSENFESGTSDGYLFADNEFYKGGISFQQQITDQYKKYETKKLTFDSKITYSEPLSTCLPLLPIMVLRLITVNQTVNRLTKAAAVNIPTLTACTAMITVSMFLRRRPDCL